MAETFTADDVRRHLADECEDARGQAAWAQSHDLSPAYVNDVLHGRREPGAGILAALGFRRVILYEPVSESHP